MRAASGAFSGSASAAVGKLTWGSPNNDGSLVTAMIFGGQAQLTPRRSALAMDRLYLDNAATTATRREVIEAMLPFFSSHYANPSSMHSSGQRVQRALNAARQRTAVALGARPEEIIFTSGGSEADSLALFGAMTGEFARAHFITSAIEHH